PPPHRSDCICDVRQALLRPATLSFVLRRLYAPDEREFQHFVQFVKCYGAEEETTRREGGFECEAEGLQLRKSACGQVVDPYLDLHHLRLRTLGLAECLQLLSQLR